MANYLLKFGTYTLPLSVMPTSREAPSDLAEQERPRGIGSVTQTARPKAKLLMVGGSFIAATMDALNAIFDAIYGAVEAEGVAQLFYGRDDRYYLAQKETFTTSWAEGQFGLIATVQIGFRAASPPYEMALTPTTPGGLTSGGGTITPTGTAPENLSPIWTITVTTGGAGQITLTNTATGESCVLTAPSGSFTAGDVIVLNRLAYSATYNGAASTSLVTGRIPKLVAGANAITQSAASPVALSALACSYTEWYA